MHAAFSDVLWIVLGVGVLASIWAMHGSSKEWERYGQRGLFMEKTQAAQRPPVNAAVAAAERESEIRQMVEAANARRVRRGESARDVDAEIARLTAADVPAPRPLASPNRPPARDHDLEDEVRALVQLRNQRRLRKGQAPLDVEAEISRELGELTALDGPGVGDVPGRRP